MTHAEVASWPCAADPQWTTSEPIGDAGPALPEALTCNALNGPCRAPQFSGGFDATRQGGPTVRRQAQTTVPGTTTGSTAGKLLFA